MFFVAKKEVVKKIKLQIPAGKATPAPPVGTALGPAGINFTVKSAELLASPQKTIKEMTINGQTFDTQFPTQTSATGDILVAFDPAAAMDFRLNAIHIWDKDAGKLTLKFVNHVVVYTVGSSKYTLDGTEKDLGYELGELDGLPLIPIEKLCAEVGYSCTVNDEGVVVIDTDQKVYFDQINSNALTEWQKIEIHDKFR